MVFTMVRNLKWKVLIRTTVFAHILTHLTVPTIGQDWKFITSRDLVSPTQLADVDRLNNIFVNDSRGNIVKLDSLARPIAQYAPTQYGLLTSLEAWSSLRVFLFYQDTQRYTFLDRFLSPNEFSKLPGDILGLVSLATPSSDNQLWLLDLTSINLIKFDIRFNSVTLNQSLNQLADTLKLEAYQLSEYQNRVYLGDSSLGILVFDNIGNYLHMIDKKGKDPFHFQNENLYYLNNRQLHVRSLYQDQHQIIDLPENHLFYKKALMLKNSIALIADERLDIFRYNPR